MHQRVHTGVVYVLLLQRSGGGVAEQTVVFLLDRRASYTPNASWNILFQFDIFLRVRHPFKHEKLPGFYSVVACKWHFTTSLIFAKFKSSCVCCKLCRDKCVAEGPTCFCRISFWIKCQIQFVGKDCIFCRLNRETAHIATGVHWIFSLKKCIAK